jgi:hypothetical protein
MSGAERREHEYDVCLSFAGEQRTYVEAVASSLKSQGIRVFYDADEEAELWGKDLFEHLDDIYQNRARFCVVFVSADYASKVWTTHERRSAFARALTDSDEYLLPARFDDTVIPGLRSSIGHIDIRTRTPEELADVIVTKVVGQQQDEPKPACWEYVSLGETMLRGKHALRTRYRDHVDHVITRNGTSLDAAGAAVFLRQSYARLDRINAEVETVFSADNQARALGGRGEAADVVRMGAGLVGVYEALLDWAARVRGVTVPEHLRTAQDLLARVADRPLADIGTFIDDYAAKARELSSATARGVRTVSRVDIALDVVTDDAATARFTRTFLAATENAA